MHCKSFTMQLRNCFTASYSSESNACGNVQTRETSSKGQTRDGLVGSQVNARWCGHKKAHSVPICEQLWTGLNQGMHVYLHTTSPILPLTSNWKMRATSYKLEELPLFILIKIAQYREKEMNNFAIMAITMIRLALFM